MNSNLKKMIAPVIVAVILIAYYLIYFGVLIALHNDPLKYALGILPLAAAVLMVKVLIERIKEIKEGEEDDLGQY